MNPRLIAMAGPLKGSLLVLQIDEVTIGREATNRIYLGDLAVSRRHCLIERAGDEFVLRDLDSFNGTYVNGVPVKERRLAHGDRISVGDSQFLFLLGEGEATTESNSVQLDAGRNLSLETVRLRQEDLRYLQPEGAGAASPQARLARDLNALLKISTTINSIRDLNALQDQLLELLFEVIPAERGAILLVGEEAEGELPRFDSYGRSREGEAEGKVRVSRTIVNQVLAEGVSILSNDVRDSGAYRKMESLIDLHIQSLLAVPLRAMERILGVIYLTTSDPASYFDKDHLQLVTAIAGIAAVAIDNVQHLAWLESENQRLSEEIKIEHSMVGEGPRMREALQLITRVAPSDSTVLIRGESGTGKELAARAIHDNSPRASKPFVAINCAVLNDELLASELFGHEKGAFTGAIAQKKGKLEIADGGTVFLDEIGEMSPVLQAKLLRVLQEHEFERVGGTRPIKVDIRLIAATNRDLEAMIQQGTFRQDLYYRLNVVSLTMPPLRERREDIPLLANYFAIRYGERCKRVVKGISPMARVCLEKYDWPGNVRELENAVERAVVLGVGEYLSPEDLPEAVLEAEPGEETSAATRYHESVKEAKKQLILKAVEQAQGSYTEAARLLGVHVNYLHRLIRNLNLKAALKKQGRSRPEESD
jgi:Nif-specific regulatory protein